MIDNKYSKPYKEVLEIIKHFPEEEYKKIPKEKIDFFRENMDVNYKFSIDPTVNLSEQNISKEANAIIVALFREYFATDEQKEKINEIIKINREMTEQDKKSEYKTDDIFKRTIQVKDETIGNQQICNETVFPTKYHETFFVKLKMFIFKLLHIKK